ncbi:MAG TPA: response regulator, partial [Opitutaceae bacterium]
DRLRVRVAVHDSGVGIGAAERARLFNPFEQGDDSTTRRFGGTGLGLAISKQLVEMMGGQIGFESEPGSGSTFWFELEFARSQVAEIRQAAAPVTSGRRLNVLAIDDHPTNLRVIELLVRKLGHEVESATDGASGLKRLAEGGVDAVLTDCQMPGMDGYEVTRRIRSGKVSGLDPRIPIVAVTAYATPADRSRVLGEGMDEHLAKPLREDALASVLGAIAQGRPLRAVAKMHAEPSRPAVPVGVFDRRALAVVRSLPGSNGGSLLPELIALFQKNEKTQMALLTRQVSAEDGEAVGATAHAIASNAAAFGAAELKTSLLALERAARAGEWSDVLRQLAVTHVARDRLRIAIEQERLMKL